MSKGARTIILILLGAIIIGCTPQITGNAINIPQEQSQPIVVYFCPQENCEQAMLDTLETSKKSIHCAFFDLDLNSIKNLLAEKSKTQDVKLVVDETNEVTIEGPGIKRDTTSQYSHNKFCIIDNHLLFTGSMNPTVNGATKNNNNLLVLDSKLLAINYEEEFQELWAGEFGSGEKVTHPIITLNNRKIENYFCPEDQCAEHIITLLKKAKTSIHFMTFSFTHEGIADAMLFSKAEVKGIFENRGAEGKHSQLPRLRDFGINVTKDTNPATMHHKVFIIDSSIVITGSMNPSNSGNTRNDENVLIIHDKKIAKKFVQEFSELWN
ncbi:MAG: phospholipase D-like domain-containing protein [Nanoarchaeota archaeon]|nr:phospholipase D-like domain-containing protein [Nanoarchaeota archaeon]